MLSRRRQSIHGGSFVRAPSPTKGFTPFGRSSGSRDGRPSPSPRASSNNLRDSPGRENRLSSLAETPVASLTQTERTQSKDATNGDRNGAQSGSLLGSDTLLSGLPSNATNGDTPKDLPDLLNVQPPSSPPPSQLKDTTPPGQRDSEGFTLRPASNDPISLAQQEAINEGEQPQFKLDIKNEPIREEDADAQAALSNVANTLRSSSLATPSRKAGTIRGRRDVRNTMYVAAPETNDIRSPENHIPISPGQPHGSLSLRASTLSALSTGDHSTSDTQSVHSSRSLASNPAIKHADMHGPGLNSSIVETVSASFENGEVKTVAVIGELALVHGHLESMPPLALGNYSCGRTTYCISQLTGIRHGDY
jgi:F-BAR domain only protein